MLVWLTGGQSYVLELGGRWLQGCGFQILVSVC